ncbi:MULTISPECIES: HAMP domain-containing sensor histidine kinase [Niastella]|uniref:histidine kinase n=1 Tax=Niastella soli TaxID=2821487 RepID=A0ABS3YRW3_9BACT|nr:HAMP domain-containing sensor histidine kinase [Niastella soli]MBO9200656.1 HAMP domain-containing histidine kinase [Niastella soli]
MPVKLRITLLFCLIVFVILAMVCATAYYFPYTARTNNIKTRLTNRAITLARLLKQSQVFDRNLIRKIDSSTSNNLKDQTFQAYDYRNEKIYSYSDAPSDTLVVDTAILDDARIKGTIFFKLGNKEAVAYHYTNATTRIVVITAAYDKDGKANIRTLSNVLRFSFFAGIIIAFVGGYFFSGRLLRPIKEIADDVNEITAQNFARRISTGSVKDEWHYLSETLNQLLNRLQDSFETQRRFVSNASHELSTPLTAISSQLEVSLQKNREAQQYRIVMESVYQDVRHLSKLTQTLLEFAQASGDAGGLNISPVRMDEILMSLPGEMKKSNSDYLVTLSFNDMPAEEEKLIVFGNAELLFTAIKNIVSNACKYSEDHKAIIRLQAEEETITISITDKGMGIPEPELKYIFQPFYRVNTTSHQSGFGLGLSLAYRIIKLHKGTINVSSTPGQGTEFVIIIPTAKF